MSEYTRIPVSIGEYYISNDPGEIIYTTALGSCIGLCMYDVHSHTAGLAHIQLPDSSINTELTDVKPACFADRAINILLKEFNQRGIACAQLTISMAGAASTKGKQNLGFFHVGKNNIAAVETGLQEHKLTVSQQDIGGHLPRSMHIKIMNGEITIKSLDHSYILNFSHGSPS